ncbi:hypothetical protein [Roseovarius sp. MMSF_3281]|uniref:hypothetical protein n=1 Tax=Roseovarius sp. MMSF_3281 TaxID=3046694 RepID=UPI0027402D3F|nr:hypothetical protein [Roseovarius sp. MMSF_3281]
MGKVTGKTTVAVDGTNYTLFLGFSGLAELQEKHGQDFLAKLTPPEGAGEAWVPPMAIMRDIILEALQRHHGDEADRWLADDVFAADPEAVGSLIEASFPDEGEGGAKGAPAGNAKGPGKKRP